MSEFNQCQTQLRELYESGLRGSVEEFTAYRIMYLMFTNAFTDLARELKYLTRNPRLREHRFVKFALDVEAAMSINNFHRLFV